jgi:hypothetical protein
MQIQIKPFTGYTDWFRKTQSVILVERESDIEPLWKLLVAQGSYWKEYRHLIKVAPTTIDALDDLKSLCNHSGKTDINDIAGLQKVVPFIIYQYIEPCC